ncbi:PilW family protein [Tepidibacter mesophilus]|uniref:PilW family protein n=1 Tax=Tepidibacter mesophilus TaxID=655607 RepID=UPI000C080EDA|nr:prepilin-type N-terminal cleavage/methylation domain-containing protein [Tepidibacter mesophilus]
MKYLFNKKGFTLIELLIVLAIASIVIGVVGSFFISNYRLFFKADDQITVQDQAQNAMTKIIDKIRETEGIYSIEGEKDSITRYYKVDKIIFKNIPDNLLLKFNDETIFYGYGEPVNKAISGNIENFEMRLIPNTSNYKDSKGIEIKIKAKKNKSEVEIIDEVYFRNK